MAESNDLVVIDEFSSVVDRQVAKVASHAVQKSIRRSKRQFIAVTCHYDVLDWLQPGWVYQPADNSFIWRHLRCHPPLSLAIHSINRSAWTMFSHHHYVSPMLQDSAQCFGAFLGEECVAFASYMHQPHPTARNIKIAHRRVVLPDYQGVGIGAAFDEWLGDYLYHKGFRYHNVVAHPAVVNAYLRSPRWHCYARPGITTNFHSGGTAGLRARQSKPRKMQLYGFEYVPKATLVA